MPKTLTLKHLLVWRAKHISTKQFVHILSVLFGITSGIGAVTIKNATHFIQHLLESNVIKYYHHLFYFVFPTIGLILVFFMMKYVIRNKVSHGIPSTLHAISKRKGFMKPFQMYGSILTAPLTVGFGGSVGLEGPAVATGSAISANISKLFHLNQTTRNLLIGCAAAGALSSIFKAPVAAIIFAIEVFSLDLTIASMLPLLLSSISAILTCYFFMGDEILLPAKVSTPFLIADTPLYMLLGVVAALVSLYFFKFYERIQKLFGRMKSSPKRILIGGISIGLLVYLMPPLYGEGIGSINALLAGDLTTVIDNNLFHIDASDVWMGIALLAGLVLFKVIATAITFGAEGVGGIFAPSLFIGSIMGNAFARVINNSHILTSKISEHNFTLVGMAGVMAGVLHAPLTAIFLIAELTGGYDLFIPLMITAAIAFGITKYFNPHSVYTTELGRKGELITHNKDHAVLTFMDVNKVIETNFISISPEMTLGSIVTQAIVKSKRNVFPVVRTEDQKLLGVILLDNLRPIMFDQALYQSTTATDLMQKPMAKIYLETDKMVDIMKKFQDTGAWNLPVISEGKYHGFISKSKLLTAYRRQLINFTQ